MLHLKTRITTLVLLQTKTSLFHLFHKDLPSWRRISEDIDQLQGRAQVSGGEADGWVPVYIGQGCMIVVNRRWTLKLINHSTIPRTFPRYISPSSPSCPPASNTSGIPPPRPHLRPPSSRTRPTRFCAHTRSTPHRLPPTTYLSRGSHCSSCSHCCCRSPISFFPPSHRRPRNKCFPA